MRIGDVRWLRGTLCALILVAQMSFAAPMAVAGPYEDWTTPPVARLAEGPLQLKFGESLNLDASESYEPDAAFGDMIISYEWDLNGDGVYEIATPGPTYVVSDFSNVPTEWYPESGNKVTVRVTDELLNQSTASVWVWYGMNMPSIRVFAEGNDPGRLDFGKVPVGTMKMLSLGLENAGSGPSAIESVDFVEWTEMPWGERLPLTLQAPCEYEGLRVAGPGAFPLLIPAGAGSGIPVEFAPTEVGSREGTLVVQLWDGPVEIPWSAEGFVNQRPVAQDRSVSVVRGNSVVLPFAATDEDGDPLRYEAVTSPFPGVLTSHNDGPLNYLAPRDFVGTTSMMYRAFDGYEYSDLATIDITVLDGPDFPPTADSQSVTLPLGQNSIYITCTGDDPDVGVSTSSHD